MNDQTIVNAIESFVAQSGGANKIEAVREVILNVLRTERSQKFLRDISETAEGSKFILTSALLGLTISLVVVRQDKDSPQEAVH